MLVNGVLQTKERINFQGSQKSKDNKGYEAYEFFFPHDKEKYDVSVEIAPVVKENLNWFVDGKAQMHSLPVKSGEKTVFDPSTIFMPNQDFAYRFKIVDKNTKETFYHQDNGVRIDKYKLENSDKDKAKFVIIHRDRIPGKMPGVMGHALADNFNPGWEMKDGKLVKIEGKRSKDLLDSVRTHNNLFDGNLAGIIEKIKYLHGMGINRMLLTPFADHRSNHGYWTPNGYQMSDRFGNLDVYKQMNVEFAKKGMSTLADAAFVNEGLEGIHFRHNWKWGKDSYCYNWVKNTGGYPSVGILPNVDPASEEGKELFSHFKIKVTNGDYKYSYAEDGSLIKTQNKRDKTQRTFVQVYDDRFVSKDLLDKDEVLPKNDILKIENHYDNSNHNNSVIIDAFPVSEDELGDFYKRIDKYKDKCGKGESKDNADFLKSVLRYRNGKIGVKAPGNFNTWDGNVDVAKLNYTYTNKDEHDLTLRGFTALEKEAYKQATYQVRDYVQKTGVYWTKVVKNAITEGFLGVIKGTEDSKEGYKKLILNPDNISDENAACNNLGRAKEVMSNEIIDNIIDNKYYIPELHKNGSPQDVLLEHSMNYPLEAIEFSDDLTAVLGSPYLSKKASHSEDILKTRNEFFKENNYDKVPKKFRDIYYDMDYEFYHGKMVGIANKIVEKANKDGNLGLYDEKGHLTAKGKLALPLISDDITKFLLVKSLAPDVSIKNEKGNLVYDYKALRKVGLQSINGGKGICASSEEEEARKVLNLLKDGITEISDSDKDILSENIKDKFKDVSTNALKMAYVVLDKTESGLNWRTDATKDTLEIDNIRNGVDASAKEWEEKEIPIWESFVKGVRKENPNSLIILEMTDLPEGSLFGNPSERFSDDLDVTQKTLQKTGATSVSNYNVLYGSLQRMFLRDFETGNDGEGGDNYKKQLNKIAEAMTGKNNWGGKNNGFLYNMPADGVKHSHNFVGNHDKPRIMHNLVLDMGIFYNHKDSQKSIEKLTKIYADDFHTNTGTKPDTKALAMAKAIGESLIPAVDDESLGIENKKAVKEALLGGIKDLVAGNYKGKKFASENFAAVPLDIAIKDVMIQANHAHKLNLNEDDEKFKKLADRALDIMTKEARDKSHIIDKLLMTMPGDPTFYMGDQLLESGYETACKNIYVKNRGIIHWEWLDDPNKGFVKDFHEEKRKIWNIRNGKDMSALTNGDTAYLSPVAKWGGDYENGQVSAFFRYNDESNVLVLAHNSNIAKKSNDAYEIEHPFNIGIDDQKRGTDIRLKIGEFIPNPDDPKKPQIKGIPSIEKIDLSPEYADEGKNVLRKGLVGGLPLGTMFKDSMDAAAETVYGVCKEAEKYVIKQFDNEEKYKTYVDAVTNKQNIENLAKEIKLKENVMVLKKVAFRGRPNSNHIKIQAYLNSKTYLNEKPRYATLAKA